MVAKQKKRKKKVNYKGRNNIPKHNPVAKFNNQVNRPSVERDRTQYNRKKKHKGENHD